MAEPRLALASVVAIGRAGLTPVSTSLAANCSDLKCHGADITEDLVYVKSNSLGHDSSAEKYCEANRTSESKSRSEEDAQDDCAIKRDCACKGETKPICQLVPLSNPDAQSEAEDRGVRLSDVPPVDPDEEAPDSKRVYCLVRYGWKTDGVCRPVK